MSLEDEDWEEDWDEDCDDGEDEEEGDACCGDYDAGGTMCEDCPGRDRAERLTRLMEADLPGCAPSLDDLPNPREAARAREQAWLAGMYSWWNITRLDLLPQMYADPEVAARRAAKLGF